MKARSFKSFVVILAVSVILAGCAEMSPTLKGGLVGAGVCGAAGAAAGAIAGEPGKGAAIGAVGCGIIGLALGEMYSQAEKRQAEASVPRPPSESYSTTLKAPSVQASNEPILLKNEFAEKARNNADLALAERSMSLMKQLLESRAIKSQEYGAVSVAKYPKSPVVTLVSVEEWDSQTMNETKYRVTLKLDKGGDPIYFYGYNGRSSLEKALSKALFDN